MELKGVNGQLQLYDDKVIIIRKGVLSKMTQGFFKGDKSIYLSQISGIQLKPAGMMTNGYIQFTLSGGNENTKGIMKATQDENTVMFAKKDNDLVNKIKAEIEQLKTLSHAAGVIIQASAADEIRKYKQLADDGIISEEEFNSKKKELLG